MHRSTISLPYSNDTSIRICKNQSKFGISNSVMDIVLYTLGIGSPRPQN